MKKVVRFLMVCFLVVAFAKLPYGFWQELWAKENGTYSLAIIHVNDSHSHLDEEVLSLKFNNAKTYTTVGGFPRLVAKINELKKKKPHSLVLHAGDVFQGTLYYSLFRGLADSAMFNLVDWDALALGNHEFDEGDHFLARFLKRLKPSITILAANIKPKDNNPLANQWQPYVVKKINGELVGIVGIDIVQKTKESSNPSDEVIFLDEVKTAQKYIDELNQKGVNKIILLTHVGLANDKNWAKQWKGVDVIVGGDSHSLMGDFSAVGLTSDDIHYPLVTRSRDGKKVCIVQAWQYSYVVGSLDVLFDEKGDVLSCSGNSTLLIGNSFKQKDKDGNKVEVDRQTREKILEVISRHDNLQQVPKDRKAQKQLQVFANKVNAKKKEVIGSAFQMLGHNRIPQDGYDKINTLPFGSDIAPIVAKSFYELSNRANASIQNAGGVRVAVNAGNITMGTAYELLPFSNTLFEIEMTGKEIKQVLEDALSNIYDHGGSTGSFPYAYGLRYDVDATRSKNKRISNLEIKDKKTGTWNLIKSSQMYVVVTNSYTAQGKDGYKTFKTVQDKRGKGVDTFLDYALSFVRYVESQKQAGKKIKKLDSNDHCIKSFRQ